MAPVKLVSRPPAPRGPDKVNLVLSSERLASSMLESVILVMKMNSASMSQILLNLCVLKNYVGSFSFNIDVNIEKTQKKAG